MSATMADPDACRDQLVQVLVDQGVLVPGPWMEAFRAVPRHAFAPAVYRIDRTTGVPGAILTAAERDAWLAKVYSDDAIITQVDAHGTAISSSTQPGVMASMLAALDVRDGHRVLEIGTGTGYNTALLCHRLGEGNVVSVDIDPDLVDAARSVLAVHGYRPTLAAANGLDGYPPAGPYDRIIVTCSTRRVPVAWLRQLREGGMLLANLSYGVVPLRRSADGSVAGRFVPQVAGFIEARQADTPPPWTTQHLLDVCMDSHPQPTTTTSDAFDLLGADGEFDFFRQLIIPGITWCALDPGDGEFLHCLGDADTESWARAYRQGGTTTVYQDGPRRLWDELEASRDRWHAAGRPAHDRLGLTVDPDGTHCLWVDRPTGEHSWALR